MHLHFHILTTLVERDDKTGVFCDIYEIFKNTCFEECVKWQLLTDCPKHVFQMLLLLIIFNIIAIFDLIQAYVITDILFYLLGSLNYSFIFGVLDLVFFTLFK